MVPTCAPWFRSVDATPLRAPKTNLLFSYLAGRRRPSRPRSAPHRPSLVPESPPERLVQIDKAVAQCVPAPREDWWRLSFVRCPAPATTPPASTILPTVSTAPDPSAAAHQSIRQRQWTSPPSQSHYASPACPRDRHLPPCPPPRPLPPPPPPAP